MKKLLLAVLVIGSMQLFAKENMFSECKEKVLDTYNKIYICDKEQYFVEYKSGSMSIYVSKVTLISNGAAIVIKQ